MPMDVRQERGRLVAQARQIKHIDGPMWFVPSQNAGGYLVNLATGTCTCPDHAEHRMKCKHQWAVEFVRSATTGAEGAPIVTEVAKVPRPRGGRMGDFTLEEQGHLRTAIKFLRRRCGWEPLAKAIRFKRKTLMNVAYGRPPSASLAVRLARFAGVPVDDVIAGRYPPAGTCPHCGQRPDTVRESAGSVAARVYSPSG